MIVEPQPRPVPLSIAKVRSIASHLERGDPISVSWLTAGLGGRTSRRGAFRSMGKSNFLIETSSGFLYTIHIDEIVEILKISFEEMIAKPRRRKRGDPQ
jgi:hypothetical protein